jgi:hypothetical protein
MIIGMVGKARSGKDTFAEYLTKCLKERHQRNFKHAAFAAQLKAMCKEHFELSDDQLWESGKNIRETPDKRFVKDESILASEYKGNTGLVEYWTPREIMQELGGFYRRIDRDFWVKSLNLYLIGNDIKDAIITDVRHINECQYIKINKGVLIKIVRGDADEIHGMEHESETALDGMPGTYFDIEINNCGTLEDLYIAAEDSSNAIMMIENMINKGRIVKDGKE